jgi:hypothetical protein
MNTKLITSIAVAAALAGCGGKSDSSLTSVNSPGSAAISGTPESGERLTMVLTDANGYLPSGLSIQWTADGASIEGETTNNLDLNDALIGAEIGLSVSYTDNDGYAEDMTAFRTSAVLPAPAVNDGSSIAISGAAQVGQTLTATLTDGNGASGAVSYQWLANGVAIAGATSEFYVLTESEFTATITVTATYTDDDGFAETPTAPATIAVVSSEVNSAGVLAIDGDVTVGSSVTAAITDGNGTNTVVYQWKADDVDIAGASDATFTITSTQIATVLSVTADYTDADGYVEALSAEHNDVVYSFIATGETTLASALASAVDGDWIGIADAQNGDDYENMAEMTIGSNNMMITRTVDSAAVITGETCILFGSSTSGVVMDGLVFDNLTFDYGTSCLSPDASVVLHGDGNIMRNNQFLGDQNPRSSDFGSSDEYHYVTVNGTNNFVERNLFANKTTANNFEGSAISMYVNGDAGAAEGNTVQYNLFKDFGDKGATSRDSNTFAVQVGRSTGSDAKGTGSHLVQYNRFDNVNTNRRLIMVQGGGNTIHGNTILNSLGNIALENGFGNTVSENIVISSALNSEDSGISFAPLGHTIVDNFIGNTTATSADRAALHIDSDPLDASSSGDIFNDTALDMTTVIARNSFINNDRAIQFEFGSNDNCALFSYLLDFDDNLIANQADANNVFGTAGDSAGDGDAAVHESGYLAKGCAMATATDFDNNHIYSATLSDSNTFDFNGIGAGVDGNIGVDGTEDGATLTAPDANFLVEGAGPDAGIGVDIDILSFVQEANVGPNTTWVGGVVEEALAVVPDDPVLVNAGFAKLAKSSGSDCACAGWINNSVGDDGESSTGNGSDVVKFDNLEPDAIYQEFAVTANGQYQIDILAAFKSSEGGSFPSALEVRVLTGAGYDAGYTPTYYTDTAIMPRDNLGYSSIAQVETAENNVLTEVISNPGNTSYNAYTYSFNVGDNTSVALFVRGIGGPATGGAGSERGYNSGDEEIRVDSVTITGAE